MQRYKIFQTVPISCSEGDHILAPEDLPDSSPLLIYTASVVPNSYNPDNRGGCESFMMACRLYNTKVASQEEIDTHLNIIEEKYATLTSQLPQKRQKINLNDPPVYCISQVYEDSGASVCDIQPSFPDLINVEQTKPDANKKCVTKPLQSTKK
ncbi:hypothetical protein F8M41_017594 [Gigaspora margarita]|uniref:Uncharacterized protein n=1 Tax=Gigaspora margarita TaxID=4874 RepID=A0A8H4AMU9_GIGMA|nr:hypothetical protein F8M41_017594 [Gigaspora margarita]